MEDRVRGSRLSAAQLLGFLRAAPADTLHPSSPAVPVCKHVWGERPQTPTDAMDDGSVGPEAAAPAPLGSRYAKCTGNGGLGITPWGQIGSML